MTRMVKGGIAALIVLRGAAAFVPARLLAGVTGCLPALPAVASSFSARRAHVQISIQPVQMWVEIVACLADAGRDCGLPC